MVAEQRPRIQTATRRHHQKSRQGCTECKRRRVKKCDEQKPICSRCAQSFDKCIYAPIITPIGQGHPGKSSALSVTPQQRSRSPAAVSTSESTGALSTSGHGSPAARLNIIASSDPINGQQEQELSDANLYHHFLEHTSRRVTYFTEDRYALTIGLPNLASQNPTVYYSLLAVAAACIGCDTISRKDIKDVKYVNEVLLTGFKHYNLASERMRKIIANPETSDPEPLLASAMMLVKFAAASQQLDLWISANRGKDLELEALSSTPRDVIIMMRGIRSTLLYLGVGRIDSSPMADAEISGSTVEAMSSTEEARDSPALSRTHCMYSIISSTSEEAFSRLQSRINLITTNCEESSSRDIAACQSAFQLLNHTRTVAFPMGACLDHEKTANFSLKASEKISPWLHEFATRCPIPSAEQPLTRLFFTFLAQAPQEYLDLVLPLLDQRLMVTSDLEPPKLNQGQALALDIYAHWSVLMLLTEKESWFIGDLPAITLTGMLNRYGHDFVAKIWPQATSNWWPSSMLNILKEVRSFMKK